MHSYPGNECLHPDLSHQPFMSLVPSFRFLQTPHTSNKVAKCLCYSSCT